MIRLLIVIVSIFLALIYVFQGSIVNYIAEKNSNSTLAQALATPTGETVQSNLNTSIQDAAKTGKETLIKKVDEVSNKINEALNPSVPEKAASPIVHPKNEQDKAIVKPEQNNKPILPSVKPVIPENKKDYSFEQPNNIQLHQGDQVMIIGDSLQQGVAPYIASYLSRNFKIKSIDLSKQSTGLINTVYFNWPKVVKDNFTENHNIKLVIVLIGANDINLGIHGVGTYGSPAWQEEYKRRIQTIVDTSYSNGAEIIWIGLPAMGRKDLARKNELLNSLFIDKAKENKFIYISTNYALKLDNNFASTIRLDGKVVRVRTNDGVHFSVAGQKLVSRAVINKLTVNKPEYTIAEEPKDTTETNATKKVVLSKSKVK